MDTDIHELAKLMPEHSAKEQADLEADIAAHGLRDAITLYEGEILDGRGRNKACDKTGTPKRFENLATGLDPVAFVLSKNLHRRQLTTSQRAVIALALKDHYAKQAKAEPKTAGSPKAKDRENESGAKAARDSDVSPRTVYRAEAVRKERPDLIPKMQAGEITLAKATREVEGKKKQKARKVAPNRKPKAYHVDPAVRLADVKYGIQLAKGMAEKLGKELGDSLKVIPDYLQDSDRAKELKTCTEGLDRLLGNLQSCDYAGIVAPGQFKGWTRNGQDIRTFTGEPTSDEVMKVMGTDPAVHVSIATVAERLHRYESCVRERMNGMAIGWQDGRSKLIRHSRDYFGIPAQQPPTAEPAQIGKEAVPA